MVDRKLIPMQYAVLFAFEGTYVTIADDPAMVWSWLLAYFESYAFGTRAALHDIAQH